MSLYLCIYIYIYIFASIPVRVYSYIRLWIRSSIHSSVHPSIHPSIHPCIHSFHRWIIHAVSQSVGRSVGQSVSQSVGQAGRQAKAGRQSSFRPVIELSFHTPTCTHGIPTHVTKYKLQPRKQNPGAKTPAHPKALEPCAQNSTTLLRSDVACPKPV